MSARKPAFENLDLPDGERLIWQGRPSARALAIRVFHVRVVAAYFAVLIAVRIAVTLSERQSWTAAAADAAWLVIPLAAVMVLLGGLAVLYSRTTRYSLTSKRVLLQFGAVLPMTLNTPYTQVASAALKEYADGSGELPLAITGKQRLAFLLLWPHVRPWHLTKVEPMLRCLPDARHVAELLATALKAASPQAPEPVVTARPLPRPALLTSAVATAA